MTNNRTLHRFVCLTCLTMYPIDVLVLLHYMSTHMMVFGGCLQISKQVQPALWSYDLRSESVLGLPTASCVSDKSLVFSP